MLKKRRFILFTFIGLIGLGLAANFLLDDKNNVLEYERQIEERVSLVIDQFGEFMDVYDITTGTIDQNDRIMLNFGFEGNTAAIYDPNDGVLYVGSGVT